jgi:hypothetical protein
MDENLETLARQASADPTDEAAARRYDAALTRGGRGAEVRERFRMKFECPLQWMDMERTGAPGVKFCESCKREVHAVHDEAELTKHVSQGHCVAFPTSKLRHAFEGLTRDARLHSAEESAAPCVVPGWKMPPDLPEDVLQVFSQVLARTLGATPIAVRGGKLVLGVMNEDQETFEDARLLTGYDVVTAFISREEFESLVPRLPVRSRRDFTTRGVVA